MLESLYAYCEGEGFHHLVELVDDDGAQELQAEGEAEGGQSLDSQAGGGAAVELRHLRGHLQIFSHRDSRELPFFLIANINFSIFIIGKKKGRFKVKKKI